MNSSISTSPLSTRMPPGPLSAGLWVIILIVLLLGFGCFEDPGASPDNPPCDGEIAVENLGVAGSIALGEDVELEWQYSYNGEFESPFMVDEVVTVTLAPGASCQPEPLVRQVSISSTGSILLVNRSAHLSQMLSCFADVPPETALTYAVEYVNSSTCTLAIATSASQTFTYPCGSCEAATATRSELVAVSVDLVAGPAPGSLVLVGSVAFQVDACDVQETPPERTNVSVTLSVVRSGVEICTSNQTISQIDANAQEQVSVPLEQMICDAQPQPGDILRLEVDPPQASADCGAGDLSSNNTVESPF